MTARTRTARGRVFTVTAAVWTVVFFVGAGFRVLADCAAFGLPFTDLGSTGFCAEIAEAYYAGITNGTSPTTFSPKADVTRDQTAAFATRALDAALARGSRRAALAQWWTTTGHFDQGLGVTRVGFVPAFPRSDGVDVWVPVAQDGTVARIRASDGKLLGTWTGATDAFSAAIAMGRVFITGTTDPASLYVIDPASDPGAVTTVSNDLGSGSYEYVAFDGSNLWTAVQGNGSGTMAIISPSGGNTWSVAKWTVAFQPTGLLYDGSNMWVSAAGSPGSIKRMDAAGSVLQSISLPAPGPAIFDGTNLWVLNSNVPSISIVRASTGEVVATIGRNDMNDPGSISFDGERVLVTNLVDGNVSIFRGTDLSYLGSFATGFSASMGSCSDGLNFWITEYNGTTVGRF